MHVHIFFLFLMIGDIVGNDGNFLNTCHFFVGFILVILLLLVHCHCHLLSVVHFCCFCDCHCCQKKKKMGKRRAPYDGTPKTKEAKINKTSRAYT